MAKDIRNLKKLVESYYEDMPTGEYEVCPRCFGDGCEECEQGLKDITGQHKMPDFSTMVDSDITEAAGTSTIHVPRDEWPTMIILKRKLAAGGVPNAELINSHYGEHYIGIRVPSDMLQAAKDVVMYWLDDEPENDSWGRRSAYSGNAEHASGDALSLTKYSVMDSKMAEGYSSPPPLGDMIKAGFPDVAPGDRIRTRKGDHTGVITKIRVHPEKGTEEVFFQDDTGKKFKTPLSNVLKVSSVGEALDPLYYPDEEEEEEKTYMFKDGDKVRLTRDYSDGSGEVFWVSQCDPDRKRCWIGDKHGSGWYVSFGQIEPVKRKKNSFGLREAFGAPMEMEYDGFGYYYDIEEEEDNRKIWHYAVLPGGKEETLDLSPYSDMDQETFKAFVDYYKQHQRFPTRADIGSIGPLYREDVLKLVPENTLGDDMKEAAGDSLDKALARMRTPKYLEKRAIDQLKSLPQPITVVGGGYAYSANIKKDPYTWTASDGSPIKIKKLADIGAYFERYVQEEWDDFLDDVQDVDDLVRMGYIRSGAGGAYRDQADFEYKQMIGDAVGTEPPHTIVWSMGHNYKQVMRNAVKELGLQIDSQGYEGGSTLWSIVFYNDKKLTPDQWDDLLRDNVGEQLGIAGGYPNWMEVESADEMFESTQVDESKPLDKEVYNVNVRHIEDDIFGGFHTQYRVRIPKGQGDPKELVIAALKKHGIKEPFEIVGLHKGMFNRKGRDEHKISMDRPVDKHWLLNNSGEKTVTEETDMERLLKLAGMYHKPQVFETEENKEGNQSPLSDVTDFVADVRGEKPKDPTKFDNADGEKSVLSEKDVEEDYLEPPHQPDPHTNEEDDWYDPEDARRHVARMGAHPEFTGRHELKPHDPVADQAAEDEWILNKNAEEEQTAAMDDWDVFNKKGVEEAGLNNGYGEHHAVDGEDLFPSGATSNVARKVGPSGARHGNNPMSQKMTTESAKIYEQYKRDFEDFKKTIEEDKEPVFTLEFEEAYNSDTEIDGPFEHLVFRINRNQQLIGRIATYHRAKTIENRNKAGEVIESWPAKSVARIDVGNVLKGNWYTKFFKIPPEVAVDRGGQKLLAFIKSQVPEVYTALKNYKADKFVNRVKDKFQIGWQDSKKG